MTGIADAPGVFPRRFRRSIFSTNLIAYEYIRVKLERIRNGEVKAYNMYIGGGDADDGFIKHDSHFHGTGDCIVFRPDERDYTKPETFTTSTCMKITSSPRAIPSRSSRSIDSHKSRIHPIN